MDGNEEIGKMLRRVQDRMDREKSEEAIWNLIGWRDGLALWIFWGLVVLVTLVVIKLWK